MSSFLMVQNIGVASKESFSLLGASSKRSSSNPSIIGMFGSGGKHAINVLLRKNLSPTIFCGNLRLAYSTYEETVDDGLKSNVFNRVRVKYSGKERDGKTLNRTEDLGWTLDFGSLDWGEVSFALREFVSNAIDRTIEESEARQIPLDYKNVVVKIVDEKEVRAKSGFTRIFVPLTDEEVVKFYTNLGKWFLHFSEPQNLNLTILPKAQRSLDPNNKNAVIYKKGVRIREVGSQYPQSLFDYNLPDLVLDESRNCDDYKVMTYATRAIRDAGVENLTKLFTSFTKPDRLWEHEANSYALESSWGDDEQVKERRKVNWKRASENVAGEGVVVGRGDILEVAKKKGFPILQVPEVYATRAAELGLATPEKILSDDDKEGRVILESTPEDFVTCTVQIWTRLQKIGKTFGKDCPPVKAFDSMMSGETMLRGFYRDGTIYINSSLSSPGGSPSTELLATVLEETVHYLTKSLDNSRDFQEFLIQCLIKTWNEYPQ